MEPDDLTTWAADEAERLLQPLTDRWKHVQGVAARAQEICGALEPEDRPYLVAAAWLHDIGYSPDLKQTGVHQLDGAAWLRPHNWRLACLVAHHSEARFELTLRGYGDELAQYPREQSRVADALTFCDLTTGPSGQTMTLGERVAEVAQRYGGGDIVDALRQAQPHLAAAMARTRRLLSRTE
jgi:HD superfamily phosphodiesterase